MDRAKWITSQVRILFSAYRRDDYADPDGFLIQIAQVMESYPDHIISEMTNPRTGIQRRLKFPPTIAEIVEACNAEVVRLEKIERYRSMGTTRTERATPQQYNLFVGLDSPGYERMCEMAKTSDRRNYRFDNGGIWVPVTWWDDRHKMIGGKLEFQRFTKEQLEAIYCRRDAESGHAA